MELIIPFMLFILEWNTGQDPNLTRHPVMYSDEEQCRDAGAALIAELKSTSATADFRCVAIPPEAEFETMMQRIESEHVARREAREAQRERPAVRPEN